jgi:hypothetical protein
VTKQDAINPILALCERVVDVTVPINVYLNLAETTSYVRLGLHVLILAGVDNPTKYHICMIYTTTFWNGL